MAKSKSHKKGHKSSPAYIDDTLDALSGSKWFQPLTLQVATVDDDIMANILDVYSKAALQILTPSNAEKY